MRVLSTSTVAGVSTSCCWALASGVSVGRGDSAIAGCPLRSQPPPPMQARHCANICPGGRTPNAFGHAAGFFTARWRTRTLPSLLAEELPACTSSSRTTCVARGLGRREMLAAAKPPSHRQSVPFAAKQVHPASRIAATHPALIRNRRPLFAFARVTPLMPAPRIFHERSSLQRGRRARAGPQMKGGNSACSRSARYTQNYPGEPNA